ncbi:hypothetical protein RB213_001116, partial [Colletotrichum asianum]
QDVKNHSTAPHEVTANGLKHTAYHPISQLGIAGSASSICRQPTSPSSIVHSRTPTATESTNSATSIRTSSRADS